MFYFVFITVFLLIVQIFATIQPDKADVNKSLMNAINEIRQKKQIPPFTWNEGLSLMAAQYNISLNKNKILKQQQSTLREKKLLAEAEKIGLHLSFVNGFTVQGINSPDVMIDRITGNPVWTRMILDSDANTFGASLNGLFWTVEMGMASNSNEKKVKAAFSVNLSVGNTRTNQTSVDTSIQSMENQKKFEVYQIQQNQTISEDDEEKLLFSLINKARKEKGLKQVCFNKTLREMAKSHSEEMKKTGHFGHKWVKYPGSFERLRETGLITAQNYEFIAKGKYTPQQVFDHWMSDAAGPVEILHSAFNSAGACRVGEFYTLELAQVSDLQKVCPAGKK